jgi:hypothetical protein
MAIVTDLITVGYLVVKAGMTNPAPARIYKEGKLDLDLYEHEINP